MFSVRTATFIPASDGGAVQAVMMLGNQQVTATLPLAGEDHRLQAVIERLSVRVQQVTFTSTAAGGEIRALMSIGERSFVSRLAMPLEDQDLAADVNLLLEAIGHRLMQQLQAGLQDENGLGSGQAQSHHAAAVRPTGHALGRGE